MSTLASVEGPPRRLDRRVRKTRRALGDALLELCAVKPYESITVQDVIDRADVSRSTFYAHYIDKDSLLVDSFRDLRQRSREQDLPRPDTEPLCWSLEIFRWTVGLANAFDCGPDALRSIMTNPACALAAAELEREVEVHTRADLARLSGRPTDRVPALVVTFVVGAFMRLLIWWLDAADRPSPEEIDRQFRILALPGTAAALGVGVTSKSDVADRGA